jgi:hypothetical protein
VGPAATYDVPDYDPANDIPPEDPVTYRTHQLPNDDQIGVDPNRNWTTQAWGYDPPRPDTNIPEDWNPSDGSYFGPNRASERETSNIQAYLGAGVGYGVTIDYHSYGRYVLVPSEAYNRHLVGVGYQRTGGWLASLIVPEGEEHYTYGTSVGTVGYDATGATDDHMAYAHNAAAFTVELDPVDDDVDENTPGFLLPEDQIMGCFEANIRGALAAIAAPGPAAGQLQIDTAMGQFGTWDVYGRGNQLPE